MNPDSINCARCCAVNKRIGNYDLIETKGMKKKKLDNYIKYINIIITITN